MRADLGKGTAYQVELSGALKALVIIQDANGDNVGSSLDAKGKPQDQFSFKPPTSGKYTIVVASQGPYATGSDKLTVR